VKWIRFTAENASGAKTRADSVSMVTALADERRWGRNSASGRGVRPEFSILFHAPLRVLRSEEIGHRREAAGSANARRVPGRDSRHAMTGSHHRQAGIAAIQAPALLDCLLIRGGSHPFWKRDRTGRDVLDGFEHVLEGPVGVRR
jgi:hypothetical protein